MLFSGNSLQKSTVIAIPYHDIIFHILVSASSFCFHTYIGGPFDLILIVGTVV